jgi:hypothetical protein
MGEASAMIPQNRQEIEIAKISKICTKLTLLWAKGEPHPRFILPCGKSFFLRRRQPSKTLLPHSLQWLKHISGRFLCQVYGRADRVL